jgi:uncharacterized protein YyaL (SSP411 family)
MYRYTTDLVVFIYTIVVKGSGMPDKTKKAKNSGLNRLYYETSPYLFKHAENPVDWYPWRKDAFDKAIKEDKPVFLSIGYSSCHWCHVMEKESFEDKDVAELMNEVFVNIKVDREERPDIDKIYMDIAQLMTGRGGWPLTIIMTPDKKPFFAATYIPRNSISGLIGMIDLVKNVKEIWKNQKEKALNSAEEIAGYLDDLSKQISSKKMDQSILDNSFKALLNFYDNENGGFGTSQKFPMPHNHLFLLRYWHRTKNQQALKMVEKTLQAMQTGGIWDHIGYGFHRYATDKKWLLPHFEKMLYDQALLSLAYIEAFIVTGNSDYRSTAEKIFTYVLRGMTSKDGAFYTSEDADSEGEEGRFYLWTIKELNEVLETDEAEFASDIFNIKEEGNFLEEATKKRNGKNILHMKKPLEEIAYDYKISKKQLLQKIEKIRDKLFTIRKKRIHPLKDDKILTDWNGLMIASLARASGVLNNKKYKNAAIKAAGFILDNLRTTHGELFHSWHKGEAKIMASLDDYAFFIMGLIEIYESTFKTEYLREAIALNDILIAKFWDDSNGGFYFTPPDNKDVLARMKYGGDGAIPSGNSISMLNLLRLGKMTGRPDLIGKANKLGEIFFEDVEKNPDFHTQLLVAYDFLFGPSFEIIICGDSNSGDTEKMLDALRTRFIPKKIVIFKPAEQNNPDIMKLAEYTEEYVKKNNSATAYVCIDYKCNLPTNDIEEMLDLLSKY